MPCFHSASRRRFLRNSTLTALGAWAARPLSAEPDAAPAVGTGSRPAGDFALTEPFHGAVLHARLGKPVADGLEIDVRGIAPPGATVLVQGRPATRDGNTFRAAVVLRARETELVATLPDQPGRAAKVSVVWDRHSRKRYRVVIDDNSFFLRDITQKGYGSLFDCFYLAMLRDLHQKYDARFTLNIYYTTGDDWNLRQFPDKYRPEWEANADWLRLAFHAYANDPPRPYHDAPVEKLLADLDLINAEIHRFAGPRAFSHVAVVHFGATRPEAWKPLYERGARVLGGYFARSPAGPWYVNYRMDDVRTEWLSRHDLLKDFPSGIIFSKVDMVINSTPLAKVVPLLEEVVADPRRSEIVDLLTHEQYFWPFYRNYLPDHAQRMDRAIKFLTERGYASTYLQDGFLGGPA